MGLKDLFTKTVIIKEKVHDSDSRNNSGTTRRYGSGNSKYGNIKYQNAGFTDYGRQRENARGVYSDSLIARGLVGRLIDNVINTGLTWEASPLWAMIPDWKDKSDEQKYQWTETVENYFTLYSESTEADSKGRLTFKQIQRLLYMLRVKEGEYFCILRYLNNSKRTSPVAIQVLNNDQVQQPTDAKVVLAIKNRGATVKEGIEYDSTGKMIAIHVVENLENFGRDTKRIPIFGPKSGRRFVIHDANFETAEQYRGFPELAAFIYELDRLTEYDINELEATIAGALWFAAIETEKGAIAKGPRVVPAAGATTSTTSEVTPGIKNVNIGNKALLMQNLGPGQKLQGFAPNRPNSNFAAFEEVFENRISASMGMPLSVFRQKFQASYSAARAEILFFWNNIFKRRDDFIAGFLNPFYESWFTEHVKDGNFKAPGFRTIPIARRAWLYGTWNGISRPVVDPVKEVTAVQKRQLLGHTTGEREAKAYNGSDFRENTNRLTSENVLIAEANKVLDPEQFAEPDNNQNQDGGNE